MAITTLDQLVAGFQQPQPFMKFGITMSSTGGQRGYSTWYANGTPGAATGNSAGINGAALSGTISGALVRNNPTSGNAYLGRLSAFATQGGSLVLIDRLWHNSGLSVTSSAAQSITPATLPARDRSGTTNGDGVEFAIEWSATSGTGIQTVTLTYTNQNGDTGRTGTFTSVSNAPVGTFEIFTLQAGDTGVRAPTSFQQSGSRTSGTMHLVGFRRLAQIDLPAGGTCAAIDALTSAMPRIYDDSVLQFLWIPGVNTATSWIGTYSEVHG